MNDWLLNAAASWELRINRVYPFQLVTIIKHSSVAKIGIYQKLNVALTHEKYLYTDLSVVSHCQLKRSGVNNDVSILCGWKHMVTKNAALNSNVAFIGKFKKNLLEIKPRRNVAVISTKIGMKRRDTTNKKKGSMAFLDTHNVEFISAWVTYVQMHYGLVRGLYWVWWKPLWAFDVYAFIHLHASPFNANATM